MTVRKEASAKAETDMLLLTSPLELRLTQGPILTLTVTEPDPPAREMAGKRSDMAITHTDVRTAIHVMRPRIPAPFTRLPSLKRTECGTLINIARKGDSP